MKTCTICKENKEESEFYLKKGELRQSKCKSCSKSYNKQHYLKDKQKYLERALKRNARYREELKNFADTLKNGPCIDCKKTYPPYVMDFDHINGQKEANISQMVVASCSKAKILKEVAKCELVCPNCHRERTYKRRKKT
jgi:hypothetical protein